MNRQERRRQVYLQKEHDRAVALYLAKQERQQTGRSEKWNINVGTEAEEVVWLDVLQPEDEHADEVR